MARKRRWVLESDKEEIWRRRKAGATLRAIGRALNRRSAVIRKVVVARGGIAPTPRRRAPCALSRVEREEISRGIAAGLSMRTMAAALKRAPSTGPCRDLDLLFIASLS